MSGGLWFVHIDGEERGPISEQQLLRMVRDGTVRRNTLVRGDVHSQWTRAANVEGLFADVPPILSGSVDRQGLRGRSSRRWPWVLAGVAGLVIVGVSVVVVLSLRGDLTLNFARGWNGTSETVVPLPQQPAAPAVAPADAHRKAFRLLVGHEDIVNALAFAPDGQTLVSGGGSSGFDAFEDLVELSPNGLPADDAPADDTPAADPPARQAGPRPLRVWDVETARQIAAPEGHTGVVRAVAFSPDGRHALSADAAGTAILWDTETWREIRRFKGDARPQYGLGETRAINAVAFSGDGHRAVLAGWGYVDVGVFASFTRNPHLILWDLQTGDEVLRTEDDRHRHAYFDLPPFIDELHTAAWTPDGKYVVAAASGSNAGVYYFDAVAHGCGTVRTGDPPPGDPDPRRQPDAEAVQNFSPLGHDSPSASFVCAAVSPDGRRVASGDTRGRLCLWTLDPAGPANGTDRIAQAHFYDKSIRSIAFTSDGRYFATGGDDLILFHGRADQLDLAWELGPKPDGTFLTKPYHVHCVAFSRDAKYLAAGCDDYVIRLWKVPPPEKRM